MPVREIALLDHPVLHHASEEVTSFDETLSSLVADLWDTLEASSGRGLAAPQIGVPLRVFVLRMEGISLCAINPVLQETSAHRNDGQEGCLSVPGFTHPVRRSTSVVLEHWGQDGTTARLQLHGALARAAQHEVDHLDGSLYLDRLSAAERAPYEAAVRDADWVGSSSVVPNAAYRALWAHLR